MPLPLSRGDDDAARFKQLEYRGPVSVDDCGIMPIVPFASSADHETRPTKELGRYVYLGSLTDHCLFFSSFLLFLCSANTSPDNHVACQTLVKAQSWHKGISLSITPSRLPQSTTSPHPITPPPRHPTDRALLLMCPCPSPSSAIHHAYLP